MGLMDGRRGLKWERWEDEEALRMADEGYAAEDVALRLGRPVGGVVARLRDRYAVNIRHTVSSEYSTRSHRKRMERDPEYREKRLAYYREYGAAYRASKKARGAVS